MIVILLLACGATTYFVYTYANSQGKVTTSLSSSTPSDNPQGAISPSTPPVNTQVNTGCFYGNPPCGQQYDCMSNACVKKNGCQYDNPSCAPDYKCENNQCLEKVLCGKFGCQAGESSSNCCIDCGCSTGETCENNICVVKEPKLTVSATQSNIDSITIYLSKTSTEVGTLSFTNTGNDEAKDTAVTLSSSEGYFPQKIISIGSIQKGSSTSKTFSLDFAQKALTLTNDLNNIPVMATISYYNSANQKKSTTTSFSITVKGRNYNVPKNNVWVYSPWVTPNQNKVREFATKATGGLPAGLSDIDRVLAAKWIFQSMRAYGVKYVNERVSVGDYNQFAIETLQRKAGDCEDQAILFSSLMESIGVPTALVEVPGHVYSGFYTINGTFVPVETTADDFEWAVNVAHTNFIASQNAGVLQLFKPSDYWATYQQVLFENEPNIPLPDIKKQVLSQCQLSFSLSLGFVVTSKVKFQNNGDAPGAGCVSAVVYQGGELRDAQYPCWTVLAGQTLEKDIVLDTDFGQSAACSVK